MATGKAYPDLTPDTLIIYEGALITWIRCFLLSLAKCMSPWQYRKYYRTEREFLSVLKGYILWENIKDT